MEPNWRVIGASVQGTSHKKRNVPCQDAHGFCLLPEDMVVVAVADGAGSAQRSHEGARCAVDQAIASVEAGLNKGLPQDEPAWKALLAEAFGQARQAVVQLAEAAGLLPRAFATTLSCAVVSDGWLTVGQIGDGVVVARGQDGDLFAASHPQHGEYANETYFLTMKEALKQLDVRVYPQTVRALAAMTDGLIRLAMSVSRNEPYPLFFEPLLAFAAQAENEEKSHKQLAAFLASERVCDRTDDDKTLVLLARPSGCEPEIAADKDADA